MKQAQEAHFALLRTGQWIKATVDHGPFGAQPAPTVGPVPPGVTRDARPNALERPWHKQPEHPRQKDGRMTSQEMTPEEAQAVDAYVAAAFPGAPPGPENRPLRPQVPPGWPRTPRTRSLRRACARTFGPGMLP